MEPPSVGLDHDALSRPGEVGRVRSDPVADQRPREAGPAQRRQVRPLELRARRRGQRGIDHASGDKLLLGDELQDEGLGAEALEPPWRLRCRQVEQRSERRGDGERVDRPDLGLSPGLVNDEALTATRTLARDRDLDERRQRGEEIPDDGGGRMAAHRARTSRDQRRPHPPEIRERLMPDGVDATVDDEQAARPDPVVDRGSAQAQADELSSRDDALLARGESGDRAVDAGRGSAKRALPTLTAGIAGDAGRGVGRRRRPALASAIEHTRTVDHECVEESRCHRSGTLSVRSCHACRARS